jgi:quercetin dioxygenase-like cupin family protein
MDRLDFGQDYGRSIEAYGSIGARMVPLLRNAPASMIALYLEPGGLLGPHPAVVDQLLLVVRGSGRARAGGEECLLRPGTAVLWRRGEEHETRAGPDGLVALIIEGAGLAEAVALSPRDR